MGIYIYPYLNVTVFSACAAASPPPDIEYISCIHMYMCVSNI